MSVVRVATVANSTGGLQEFEVTGTSYAPEGRVFHSQSTNTATTAIATGKEKEIAIPADYPALLQSAACAALCNDSHLTYAVDKGIYQPVGEATEVALRVFAEKIGLPGYSEMPSSLAQVPRAERATYCNEHWEQQQRKIFTLEFSRDRKMMSTLCSDAATGRLSLFAKGAPEAVLSRCSTALTNDGSGSIPMTPALIQEITAKVEAFGGGQALRCLALAVRPWGNSSSSSSSSASPRMDIQPSDETGLCFVGLVGMQDPPRPEVRRAVEECRIAGIRVIMVTGDNKATAESVGKQTALLGTSGGLSISGREFDELTAGQQAAAAADLVVFSRVEPTHKSKLVELLQSQGHVVAMTGDGVNDAPALKRADIGVAMGSGTAVAKHASDMVLADDNFTTIVAAVAAGRAIYANTKQFIRYMVSSNIGEVVAIFSAALLGIPECLNPVQLLWVNLVTDGLPATAIGFNKPDAEIMRKRPRRADEGIVDRWLFFRYLVVGAYVGAVTAAGFIWWFISYEHGPQMTWSQLRDFQHCGPDSVVDCTVFRNLSPSTISMSVLVIVEMFNALNALSENCSLLEIPPWSNPWLLGAIAVSVFLHLIILYVAPLATMFSVTALSWAEWKMVLWLSAPVILVDEVLKFVSRNFISVENGGSSGTLSSASGVSDGVSKMVRLPSLNALPGYHAARVALQKVIPRGLVGAGSASLSRKSSGEGLPLIASHATNNNRRHQV
jgi:magnesium-transporting ATPase (P-type)